MRVAAIDIGTNTILMLIADVDGTGTTRVIRDEQIIARLGQGVDEHRRILPETFDRALASLRTYRAIADDEQVERVAAFGTSFLRDAGNRQEFLDFVAQRLAIEIRLLSGEEEASLTYLGAVSGFSSRNSKEPFAVLDIGGGSTELTSGTGFHPSGGVSLDIGCVRLTERFVGRMPPSPEQIEQARSFIDDNLVRCPSIQANARLIGVAGTLTTLAALDLQLEQYDPSAVNGHQLSRHAIEYWFDRLKSKTVEEIMTHPQILPARADVLLAGILILVRTMERLGRDDITVTDRGLRYGIALRAAGLV